jgi:hypothetical protein
MTKQPTERRQLSRHKSLLRGCIYFNKSRSSLDCLVRDMSAVGARLVFSSNVSVPDIVQLYIPQKEQTLHAQVQWRHGDEVGIVFATTARDQGGLASRVEKLEAELAALRRSVNRLKMALADQAEAAA